MAEHFGEVNISAYEVFIILFSEMWNTAVNLPQELEKNKFVFVNRNKNPMLPKHNTVLINPHFKENKKVFLNPKFQISKNEITSRPKVHVNPNMLKSIPKTVMVNPSFHTNVESKEVVISEKQIIPIVNSGINQVPRITKPVANPNYFQSQKWNSYYKTNANDSCKKVFTKTNIVNIPQRIQSNANPIDRQLASAHSHPNVLNTFTAAKNLAQSIYVQSHAAGDTCRSERVKLNQRNNLMSENQRKIHTRLKIVNVCEKRKEIIKPSSMKQNADFHVKDNSICTRFKYIRKGEVLPRIQSTDSCNKSDTSSLTSSGQNLNIRRSLVSVSHLNNSFKKNEIMTRYKYIRNGAKVMKINRIPVKSKYKIVNNAFISGTPQEKKSIVNHNSSIYRKKYVFVNKYNSSSFLANNVILRNSKQGNLIRINGILYKNSPCLLKKASLSAKNNQSSSRLKGTGRQIPCKGKYKIVRPQLASKLKKSNMPCPIYRRTGKCNGQKNGKCIKVHNPDLIILCKGFLRGDCHNDNCLLSHKVSSEKMPTCKYFLEGSCNKVECQYSHVKISSKADICKDFLEGFCKEGIKCDKRHQFLCPEYEKTKKCSKPKCPYPHGSSKVIESKPRKKNFRKINQQKLTKSTVQNIEENIQIRYYEDKVENSDEPEKQPGMKRSNIDEVGEMAIPKRKKLGSLPSFIPII